MFPVCLDPSIRTACGERAGHRRLLFRPADHRTRFAALGSYAARMLICPLTALDHAGAHRPRRPRWHRLSVADVLTGWQAYAAILAQTEVRVDCGARQRLDEQSRPISPRGDRVLPRASSNPLPRPPPYLDICLAEPGRRLLQDEREISSLWKNVACFEPSMVNRGDGVPGGLGEGAGEARGGWKCRKRRAPPCWARLCSCVRK